MADQTGQRLGNYTLVRLLGSGGFAEVYLGEHIYLKNLAAIKVLQTQLGREEVDRFVSEARLLVGLRHPHIVRVLEFGVENTTPFLIMDYAPNGTLRQRYPRGTRLAPDLVVKYVRQIASALQYAHNQKLIHRDIKPENLLFHTNDEILLGDFGIALIAQNSHQQSTQNVIGTATYMAPEQIQGKPTIASDQYSLGIVVYEWLSGFSPFQGSFTEICAQHVFSPPPPLSKTLPKLSPAIENVVMTALAKDQRRRFASVEAFATALEQACQANPSIQSARTTPSSGYPAIPPTPSSSYPAVSPTPSSSYPAPPPSQEWDATFVSRTPEAGFRSAYPSPEASYPPPVMGREFAQASDTNAPSTRRNSIFLQKQEKLRPTNNGERPVAALPLVTRRTLPVSVVALLILLTVLLTGGFGLFYYSVISSQFQHQIVSGSATTSPTQSSSPITSSQPTPTSASQATPTNTPQPTPTSVPPTPTAIPQPTKSTGGNLVLNDPLTAPSANQWDVVTYGNNNKCSYTNGEYHSVVTQTGSINFCIAEATNFANFTYQVNMRILSGTTGDGGGLIFRSKYRLRVGTDGSFDLVNGTATLFNGSSSAIKTGLNQTNVIKVKVQGTIISFYVNDVFIQKVTDSASFSGPIGVFAVEFTQPTEVAFTHAQVWQL